MDSPPFACGGIEKRLSPLPTKVGSIYARVHMDYHCPFVILSFINVRRHKNKAANEDWVIAGGYIVTVAMPEGIKMENL